jgi:hypothetical protein
MDLVINKKVIEMKNVKVNITEKERAVLNYAMYHCKGEIIEPANDDYVTMNIIVSLYNKHLVRIDFKNDKLFVSSFGRGLLCI